MRQVEDNRRWDDQLIYFLFENQNIQVRDNMNEEATAMFSSIINDQKLMPLSSFKSNKFSKYNIFPHAHTLPSFFQNNLQSDGRIVKYLKGPQGPLRAFYYQLFKLGYQIQCSVDYSAAIKNIIFSPTLTTYSSSPSSGKQYNINQYKRIIAEFLKLLQTQVIPNAELTFSQFPIIDEAMLAILQLIIQTKLQRRDSVGRTEGQELYKPGIGCTKMENLTTLLQGLCEMFQINLEVFDNCYSFAQSDIFLYVENPQNSYLAFLSEMAEVESYEKTSESKSGMDKQKEQISNSYIEQEQEVDHDVYKDIRLSAGNRGTKTRNNTNLNRSLPGNNTKTSYSLNQPNQDNILSKDYQIGSEAQNQPAYPTQTNQYHQFEDYSHEQEQKDGPPEESLEKNVFDSCISENQDENAVKLDKQKKLKQQLETQNKKNEELDQPKQDETINQIQEGIRQIQELIKSKPVQSTHIIKGEQESHLQPALAQSRSEPQSKPNEIPFGTKNQPKLSSESQRFSKTSSDQIQNSNYLHDPPAQKVVPQDESKIQPPLQKQKMLPKSLYDVHTEKSIASFNNSVVQTKAQHCDVTDIRAISEYQLRSLSTLKSKGKINLQSSEAEKKRRKGLFERKKEYGEEGGNIRRKSQVKLNNVVYEYQFKAFKYQKNEIKPVSIDSVIQNSKQKYEGLVRNSVRKITQSFSLTIKNEKYPHPNRQNSTNQINPKQIKIQQNNPELIPTTNMQIPNNQKQSWHSNSRNDAKQPQIQFFVPKAKNIENAIKLNNKLQNKERFGEKLQINTIDRINGNQDSLGTFYRQFSNTKVMQAMNQPFKTKVKSTRQKYKGIRSKDFKGFH